MPVVRFLNNQSWSGGFFCHKPGDIIELEQDIAMARETAGLGAVVADPPPEKKKLKSAKVE